MTEVWFQIWILIEILASQSNMDILVISETWLNNSELESDVSVWVNVYWSDRIVWGRGIAIFTKDNLSVSVFLATSVPKQFDCLILNVGLGHNNQLTTVGVSSEQFIWIAI